MNCALCTRVTNALVRWGVLSSASIPIHISNVKNPSKLFRVLKRIDVSVPARTDGRKTAHTETWTVCRLLSTLANAGHLSFPISVTHRDRPDFLIEADNTRIGVEVTEAISEQYAAYCALAEREFPNVFLEPAHFRWGKRMLSKNEMRSLLRKSQLTSDGWSGDRAEQEWAQFIQSVVETKLCKLANPDFVKFDHSWLSVYDNLPLPNVHLGKAIALLIPLIKDSWKRGSAFDVLYIEHGPVIAEITVQGSQHHVLYDLWE